MRKEEYSSQKNKKINNRIKELFIKRNRASKNFKNSLIEYDLNF